jgi:hypothetical protein
MGAWCQYQATAHCQCIVNQTFKISYLILQLCISQLTESHVQIGIKLQDFFENLFCFITEEY